MASDKSIIVRLKNGNSVSIFSEPKITYDSDLREPILTNQYGQQFFMVPWKDVEAVYEPLKTEPEKNP